MYNIERKSEILKIIEAEGRVEVNELATRFNASRETIRRDLREMEDSGLVKRTHGGAVFEPSTLPEFPVEVREIRQFKEKNAICEVAVAAIQDGDSIFVDNSSTCLYMLQYVPTDLHLTVITNSIKLLLGSIPLNRPNLEMICLGGVFHGSNLATFGGLAQKNAAEFFPGKAFVSCAGMRFPDQFTDSSLLETDTKRLMLERSQQVFMLADHTKFERVGPVFLSEFSSVDVLITDAQTNPAHFAALEKAGVRVRQATLH